MRALLLSVPDETLASALDQQYSNFVLFSQNNRFYLSLSLSKVEFVIV